MAAQSSVSNTAANSAISTSHEGHHNATTVSSHEAIEAQGVPPDAMEMATAGNPHGEGRSSCQI